MFCGIIWFAADVEAFTPGTGSASVTGLFDFGTAMADGATVEIHIHVETEDAWTVRLKAWTLGRWVRWWKGLEPS